MSSSSRCALVTGAAGGLGGAIADRLHADGWSLALIDLSRDVEQRAEELRATGDGRPLVARVGSVADETFARTAAQDAAAALGHLDLLVNAAGIGGDGGAATDLPLASFRRVLDVNVCGSFTMAQAVAQLMIESRSGGSIVNVGSIFGQQAVAGSVAYCTSKGAITLLTQALALELAPHGIRVNTVSPGFMATEMHWDFLRARAQAAGSSFEEEVEAVRRGIPLGRHGTGDDMAGTISWLASPDAAYVTGQTIGVNGGVQLS